MGMPWAVQILREAWPRVGRPIARFELRQPLLLYLPLVVGPALAILRYLRVYPLALARRVAIITVTVHAPVVPRWRLPGRGFLFLFQSRATRP